MSKPRIVDLFCCAGGGAVGYYRAGYEVVGVDIKPQPHYPFEFHQADALEFYAEHWREFDVAHASPPCQAYTAMQHICKNGHNHPDLVDPTRQLLKSSGKPFVIENVIGAPLRIDLMLCGTMFGLPIIRHRIFESNIPMPLLVPVCHHEKVYDPWHKDRCRERAKLSSAMKIDWFMTRQEVREAIPPAYTEFIGRQFITRIL